MVNVKLEYSGLPLARVTAFVQLPVQLLDQPFEQRDSAHKLKKKSAREAEAKKKAGVGSKGHGPAGDSGPHPQ